MSKRTTSLLVAALIFVVLLACKTKKGVASSLTSRLPYNPAGAGAVKAEDTRCQAVVTGTDLRIKCSAVYLAGMVEEANTEIQTLLTVECENIKKAGFLGINVDWVAGPDFENAALLLEKDGKPDCTLKAF